MGKNLTLHSGRFIPGKRTGYTLYRRRCGPLVRYKRVWKSTPLEFDPRTVFEASRWSNSIYILFSSQKGIIGLLQNICWTCISIQSCKWNQLLARFFLVNFSNFLHKLYMFRTSPRPSSAGITIFIWHFFFYISFWVIPSRLNFICRRFGTLASIFIGWKL